ncbi:hypothetical protein LOD99_10656 [Oopsacas minuta]|uniref:Uncharacterized protein n=1 Tax=Oopsacas minuta TaxID=111878 RepID=A0AAV7KEJ5_9METZ|nr:hypothetical protein LOD99_10656 [Oopsacas minuta]
MESLPDELESKLSELRDIIKREKNIIENRFTELNTAFLEKKNCLLEKKFLKDQLQSISVADSLDRCFIRMDDEIVKKKPNWTIPKIEVKWNIQNLFVCLEKICEINVKAEVKRRSMSIASFDTSESTDEKFERMTTSWSGGEVITGDNITKKEIITKKRPSIISWEKELPTLEREIVYADNLNGTFKLEWNGECFEKSNIELSVGIHMGSLWISDTNTCAGIDTFEVKDIQTGVQQLTLHVQKEEFESDFTEFKKTTLTKIEETKQNVQLIWKKQYATLNTCIEYIDNINGSIALEWTGECFQSKQVEMSLGDHHGMLS